MDGVASAHRAQSPGAASGPAHSRCPVSDGVACEMPEDFLVALQARLSQPDQPHRFLITPNPPNEDHWLARAFAVDNSRPGYRYIRTTVHDNRQASGEEYIADLEAAYPPGSVLRRRVIDGQRGLSVVGGPVYAGYFQRPLHVVEDLACHPEAPL